MMIVYNLTGAPKPEDMVDASIMPKPGDFMIKNGRGGDKFMGCNLDAGLKEKGIKTVIITGTSAQGAVGTRWGALTRNVTVTRSDLIKYAE